MQFMKLWNFLNLNVKCIGVWKVLLPCLYWTMWEKVTKHKDLQVLFQIRFQSL
jgi:hypothetical protein